MLDVDTITDKVYLSLRILRSVNIFNAARRKKYLIIAIKTNEIYVFALVIFANEQL